MAAGGLGLLVLGCGGLGSLTQRDPTQRGVTITTAYPGASPTEVEQGISMSVETSIVGVSGVDRVESLSLEGASVVTAWYTPKHTDMYALRVALMERLQQAQAMIPDDAESPYLGDATPQHRVLTRVAIKGSDGWQACARALTHEAMTVPGVDRALAAGLDNQRLAIRVHAAHLSAAGLSMDDLQGVMAGSVPHPSGALIRIVEPKPGSIEDLDRTVIALRDARPIYLSDVATIGIETDPQASAVSLDGQPAALLSFYRHPDAQHATVMHALGQAMERVLARCEVTPLSLNMAPSDGVLAVDLELPGDESHRNELAQRITAIGRIMEPANVLLELGRPAHPSLGFAAPERARLVLRFDPAPAPDVMAELIGSLRTLPELEVLGWEGPGSRSELMLRGGDHDLLASVADTITESLWVPDQQTAVHDGSLPVSPEILIDVDRERLGAYGLSPMQISQAVRAATDCLPAGELGTPGDSIPVVLCSTEPGQSPGQALLDASVTTVDGSVVPITAVASIELRSAPGALFRSDLLPALRLEITSTEPFERRLREAVQATIEQQALPAGVSVELVGVSGSRSP